MFYTAFYLFPFFYRFFSPSKANQGRKLLVSLVVVVNVETLSTNPVKGKY